MSLLKEYMDDIEKFQSDMLKKYDEHLIFNFEVDNNFLFDTLRVTCSEGDEIFFSSDDEPEYYYMPLDEVDKIKVSFYEEYNAREEYKGYIYKDEQGYFLKAGHLKTKHFNSLEDVMNTIESREGYRRDYFDIVENKENTNFDYKIYKEAQNDN